MSNSKQIWFFDYPALFAQRKHEYREVVGDVLERGAYIMQKDLTDFETALAAYLGVRHTIGVADGTLALLMSLKAALGTTGETVSPYGQGDAAVRIAHALK